MWHAVTSALLKGGPAAHRALLPPASLPAATSPALSPASGVTAPDATLPDLLGELPLILPLPVCTSFAAHYLSVLTVLDFDAWARAVAGMVALYGCNPHIRRLLSRPPYNDAFATCAVFRSHLGYPVHATSAVSELKMLLLRSVQQRGGPGDRPKYSTPGCLRLILEVFGKAACYAAATDSSELAAARSRHHAAAVQALHNAAHASTCAPGTPPAATPAREGAFIFSPPPGTPPPSTPSAFIAASSAATGGALCGSARATRQVVLSGCAPGAYNRLVTLYNNFLSSQHGRRVWQCGPNVLGGVPSDHLLAATAPRGPESFFPSWSVLFPAVEWGSSAAVGETVCHRNDAEAVLNALRESATRAPPPTTSLGAPVAPAPVPSSSARDVVATWLRDAARTFNSAPQQAATDDVVLVPIPPLPPGAAALLRSGVLPPLSGYRRFHCQSDSGPPLAGAEAAFVAALFAACPATAMSFIGSPLSRLAPRAAPPPPEPLSPTAASKFVARTMALNHLMSAATEDAANASKKYDDAHGRSKRAKVPSSTRPQ